LFEHAEQEGVYLRAQAEREDKREEEESGLEETGCKQTVCGVQTVAVDCELA